MLIVRAISFHDFQPMWSWPTNVTDRQMDRVWDRRMACNRNTALCTIVHRAVKKLQVVVIVVVVVVMIFLLLVLMKLHLRAAGRHLSLWDHTVGAIWHKWTHPTPSQRLEPQPEAGTRFIYPRQMEGWVDLGDWLHTTHSWSPVQVLCQIRCWDLLITHLMP